MTKISDSKKKIRKERKREKEKPMIAFLWVFLWGLRNTFRLLGIKKRRLFPFLWESSSLEVTVQS